MKGPQERSKNMVSIPEDQKCTAPKGRPNHEVFVSKTVISQPGIQNTETVLRLQTRLLQIKPYRKYYETRKSSKTYQIAQVELSRDLKMMTVNSGDKPITLRNGQQVATADSHTSASTESPITNAENFGIVENEHHTYKKRTFIARDTVRID